MNSLAQVSLVVRDYDEALEYYVGKLGFTLLEDTRLDERKRWVVVAPSADGGARLLLARASGQSQEARIGDQSGGRVFLFLETEDFESTYASFVAKGVEFLEAPRKESYGMVAVFRDLYGNKWDLVENKEAQDVR